MYVIESLYISPMQHLAHVHAVYILTYFVDAIAAIWPFCVCSHLVWVVCIIRTVQLVRWSCVTFNWNHVCVLSVPE